MKPLKRNSPAEEKKINEGIAKDPDTFEATAAQLKTATRGRPKLQNPKQAISIRLDAEVIEHFKATGKGWQSKINEVLRGVVKEG